MLYSPINYQGNKSRIVCELLNLIPKDTHVIHEIFCGSAILSLASDVKCINLNDTNHYILDLIEYFRVNTAAEIIRKTDDVIFQYGLTNTYYEGRNVYVEEKHEGLSRYNKEAYNRLKHDYNEDKDISKLFVLVIYGFNHYLRFNGKDEFNVPVGKTDFVKSLRTKTIEYCQAVQSKKIFVTNYDFRNKYLYTTKDKKELFYFDPPYLITQAPYNSFWNKTDEKELLEILDSLNDSGHKYDIKLLNKELLILAGVIRDKSKFDEISEPLRLEYLLALLIGKKYGTAGLVSNIIYNEEGEPLHFAPSGKCDIVYIHADGSFIFEPTMQRGRNQILNNETTNVARHVEEQTKETGIEYRAIMIAPYVHPDVARFFKFESNESKVKIAPININRMVGLVYDSGKVKDLGKNFDLIVSDLLSLDNNTYSDKINTYETSNKSYMPD